MLPYRLNFSLLSIILTTLLLLSTAKGYSDDFETTIRDQESNFSSLSKEDQILLQTLETDLINLIEKFSYKQKENWSELEHRIYRELHKLKAQFGRHGKQLSSWEIAYAQHTFQFLRQSLQGTLSKISQPSNDSTQTEQKEEQKAGSSEGLKLAALIIIEGKNGSGSGFIARLKDRFFIITNIHVIAGNPELTFKLATGEPVKISNQCFIAQDRDVAIIPVESREDFYEVADAFDSVTIGMPISVYGNSQGSSVITSLGGNIQGIGANSLEVSAKFVPGNSGSPIFLNDSGQVIGVASYIEDRQSNASKWEIDTEFARIRRFAYRVDNIEDWNGLTFDEIEEIGSLVNDYEVGTYNFIAMVDSMGKDRTIPTFTSMNTRMKNEIKRFFDEYNPSKGKSYMNERALISLKNGVNNILSGELNMMVEKVKYPYFIEQIKDLHNYRLKTMELLNAFEL